jgi:serine phosphatase RsbU (regulator of sigma subunit)
LARSGDHYLVKPFEHGLLAAVVDGLGHGEEAAQAAELAVETLGAQPAATVEQLLKDCHEKLRRTRGAVLSLALFNHNDQTAASTMTWLGVGNVKGLLVRAARPSASHEWLFLRGGVVGYNLPNLRPLSLPIAVGDQLIFVTDGIRSGFDQLLAARPASSPVPLEPQLLANAILEQYSRHTDDALVLVLKYMGPANKDEQ